MEDVNPSTALGSLGGWGVKRACRGGSDVKKSTWLGATVGGGRWSVPRLRIAPLGKRRCRWAAPRSDAMLS